MEGIGYACYDDTGQLFRGKINREEWGGSGLLVKLVILNAENFSQTSLNLANGKFMPVLAFLVNYFLSYKFSFS
mgnify:CR=1 FL=1